MSTETFDNPFKLEGVLANFWHRIQSRPDMAPAARRYLLYQFTYNYGNEIWMKQNHHRDTRALWLRVRMRQAYELRGHYCWACQDVRAALWHHIVPIVRGGTNSLDNLVPLCWPCHDAAHHSERQKVGKDWLEAMTR